MARRNYSPPQSAAKLRHSIDDHRLLSRLSSSSSSSSSAARPHPEFLALEDRVASQHREIQSLLADNQRFAATHVALKQELSLAEQEIRLLSAAADDVKAERDAQIREVYERSLKLEAEVRQIDSMAAELAQVRSDVHKLGVDRKELTAQLRALDEDVHRARDDLKQVPLVKAEIEAMHEEIRRGRAALERERKTQITNLEHSRLMEKQAVSLARAIEMLHAEQANSEKRARAAAAAAANSYHGHVLNYDPHEMGYGGSSYPTPYGMHQGQIITGGGPSNGSGTGLHGGHSH